MACWWLAGADSRTFALACWETGRVYLGAGQCALGDTEKHYLGPDFRVLSPAYWFDRQKVMGSDYRDIWAA